MSNIEKSFKNGKAFIAFLTCGDPDLETTENLITAMARSGVDLIELGIPFSDPTAEGPVIQAANIRALSNGTTTDKIFNMVKKVRKKTNIPMVFMTYANVVFSYGTEKFVEQAADIGIDGLILPDVPFEEKSEFSEICKKHGLEFISLIAPTSNERIEKIAKTAEGFIYCVSSLGVTGTRSKITSDIDSMIAAVRANTDVPTAIGFGISNAEQAAQIAAKSDGIIIGSAIVKIIAEYGKESVPYVEKFTSKIAAAIK